MAFMQKQAVSGVYYEVEGDNGTDFIPESVCGPLSDFDDIGVMYSADDAGDTEDSAAIWAAWCASLRDYVESRRILSITKHRGILYRLSAPGYMDCTSWTPDADSSEFEDDGE